ncbi:unnamed protein product [Symbiodinium sp. KB8]|nr:unnamed protein product [Symbiodinium sp. KB8]
MLVVPTSAGVVLPLHVRTGEPEHLEKRWQEAVAPVLTEPFNAKGVAGDLALRMDCLESEVNVAIAARLEKLEKEVFSVSSRLQMNLLDLEVKGPSSTSRSGMIGVTKADPKRAIERLDSKLDGAVHQLMEQVQQLRSMTTERFRETEQKIADCQAALTRVFAKDCKESMQSKFSGAARATGCVYELLTQSSATLPSAWLGFWSFPDCPS